MFIAYVVVAVLLSAVLVLSARGKLTGDPRVVDSITGLGVPRNWFPFLAGAEIAGALGLLAGIVVRPLGLAAAVGVVLYFVGAVAAHLRAGDTKGLTAPAPILLAALVTLTLRSLAS